MARRGAYLQLAHDCSPADPSRSVHEARIAELNDDVPRGKLRSLWTLVEKLDRWGVEARGIERVMPDERSQSCE